MDTPIYDAHPAPDWARRNWTSLDGEWTLSRKGKKETVVVPFSLGTPASRVAYADGGTFVYSRAFELPDFDSRNTYLLRVGAADYETRIQVNGRSVGSHVGGYASFAFDITAFLRRGENLLELKVRDSRSMEQVRGKQTFLPFPFAVWYTGTTGVWQSVWIEETGPLRLDRASVRFDFEKKAFSIHAAAGAAHGSNHSPLRLRVELTSPSLSVRTFELSAADTGAASGDPESARFAGEFAQDDTPIEPWSPDQAALYKVRYRLFSGETILDEVESYAGFRSLDWSGGALKINGTPTILRMALVQGYYPEGGYTPLSAAAMEADLAAVRALGFNGIRVHQKIESPYFQYLCDREGILTTFEMPSFYLPTKRAFAAYEAELRETVERDAMHPSCVLRMLFNETWGIWGVYGKRSATRRFVKAMVALAKELDPSRPVIDNSGWEHLETDIVDIHHYLGSAESARSFYDAIRRGDRDTLYRVSVPAIIRFYALNTIDKETRALFLEPDAAGPGAIRLLSEYGGFGWYKTDGEGAIIDRIEEYTRDCLDSGLFSGYCLTQLYDVETETNGLLGFDRRLKVDAERMRIINKETPNTD